MNKTVDGNSVPLKVVTFLVIPFMFFQIGNPDLMFESPIETKSQPFSDWNDNLDPCDLLPPGGKISSQSESVCVAQYASEPGKKVVQVQPNLYEVETEVLCTTLVYPSDYRVFMDYADFGDCGIRTDISYMGKPAPGYTGWQILYYYQGISVRVATSEDYPTNIDWVYDTAEEIEAIIRNLSNDTSNTADQETSEQSPQQSNQTENQPSEKQGEARKTQEECMQMQQDVADMATRVPKTNRVDIKLGVIAEVISAPESGPAVQEYCGGGEGALTRGSQIKIGDCIRNGKEIWIRMKDHETDDEGGTFIELSKDSQICFDEFTIIEDWEPQIETVSQLLSETIHVIHKHWKGTSIFSIHAGTTVLGGRATEVIMTYYPENDFVQVLALEGPVDVTSEKTGESVTLTNNQGVIVSRGDIMKVGSMSQETWDSYMKDNGFSNISFDSLVNEQNSTSIESGGETSIKRSKKELNMPTLDFIASLAAGAGIAAFFIIRAKRKSKTK